MKTVAIIPARGGSKGLPGKNIRLFCGHPLLAWSIEAARRCALIDRVVVSTDDREIAEVAASYGADVVMRPPELSGDTATSESALVHACQALGKDAGMPQVIVFLQATSPLRETSELEGALKVFAGEGCDSLFCAAETDDMLLWRRVDGNLASLNYDFRTRMRRQDIGRDDHVLVETGSFYIMKTKLLIETGNRLGGMIGVFKVPLWKSFEIDTGDSFELCEMLMQLHNLNVRQPVRITSGG